MADEQKRPTAKVHIITRHVCREPSFFRLRITDTLLAATALAHELTFVTRNTSDVQDFKVKLLNPWEKEK